MTVDNIIELSGFSVQRDAYDIICQIKRLDGRGDFLKTWADEIAGHIALAAPSRWANLPNLTTPKGERELRVVRFKPSKSWRFDSAKFARDQSPNTCKGIVTVTPPKFPRGIRLASARVGKASREWAALAQQGAVAIAAEYPNRSSWKSAPMPLLAQGLYDLRALAKESKAERESLRDELCQMAEERQWKTGMFGRLNGDGRVYLPENKPSVAMDKSLDKAALRRRFPDYFTLTETKGYTAVGFYVPGKDESDDQDY